MKITIGPFQLQKVKLKNYNLKLRRTKLKNDVISYKEAFLHRHRVQCYKLFNLII